MKTLIRANTTLLLGRLFTIALLQLLCPTSYGKPPPSILPEPFPTIADRTISRDRLVAAVKQLPTSPNEGAAYRSSIVTNSDYQLFHRRTAVIQLIQRHASDGIRIKELSNLLNAPAWIGITNMYLRTDPPLGPYPLDVVDWKKNTVLHIGVH